MKKVTIQIENLKCHGCAATIRIGLKKFGEVLNVTADLKKSSVEITYDGDDSQVVNYKLKLAKLGYPERGHNDAISIAKSYVSCAIGRVGEA